VDGLLEPSWRTLGDMLGDGALFRDLKLVNRIADLVGVQVRGGGGAVSEDVRDLDWPCRCWQFARTTCAP
jgi:hypothetical protein